MKKMFSIGFVLMLTILISACGNIPTENGSPSSSSEKVNKSQKMKKEDGVSKLMELTEQMQSGDITKEEFDKKRKEISANMETTEEMLIRTNSNISEYNELPDWAKEIGLTEPNGLTMVSAESNIIAAKDLYMDSFGTVWEGEPEVLISEAKKIMESAGLNIEYEDENTLMISGNISNYTVTITVVDNGKGVRMYYSAAALIQ